MISALCDRLHCGVWLRQLNYCEMEKQFPRCRKLCDWTGFSTLTNHLLMSPNLWHAKKQYCGEEKWKEANQQHLVVSAGWSFQKSALVFDDPILLCLVWLMQINYWAQLKSHICQNDLGCNLQGESPQIQTCLQTLSPKSNPKASISC